MEEKRGRERAEQDRRGLDLDQAVVRFTARALQYMYILRTTISVGRRALVRGW